MNSHQIAQHLFGPPIGLTTREAASWNWPEFLEAAGRQDRAALAFYRECSDAVTAKTGRPLGDMRAFAIPVDVLCRDMNATGSAGSENLIGTATAGFLPAFLGASLTARLPLRRIRGLREDVRLPRSSGATAYWLPSDGVTAITEGQPSLGEIALTPHNLAATAVFSHQLGRQAGPEGLRFIESELALALSRALDVALISGSNSEGEPASPFAAPGVGTCDGTSIDWGDICGLAISAESVQVTDEPPSWVVAPTAASVLRQRERAAGSGFILDDGRIAGYVARVNATVPVNTIALAEWSQILFATWGQLEIVSNPFSDFGRGKQALRAWLACDFAALNPAALSICENVS